MLTCHFIGIWLGATQNLLEQGVAVRMRGQGFFRGKQQRGKDIFVEKKGGGKDTFSPNRTKGKGSIHL